MLSDYRSTLLDEKKIAYYSSGAGWVTRFSCGIAASDEIQSGAVSVTRDLEQASDAMTLSIDATPMIFPVKFSTILKSFCGGPMSRIRILLCATLLLALVCLCASTAFAQYGASLQGTVTDKSGAVVAGATVTATNHASGVSRSATTGDSGFYRITGLAPGGYTVVVEAQGFKKSSTDNVAVAGESLRGFDVTVVPTQVQESVTVSAAADPLSTEDATLSSALSTGRSTRFPSSVATRTNSSDSLPECLATVPAREMGTLKRCRSK